MKVKNIMFSGFAAAILMGVGAANAVVSDATYNLANTGYVDAKVGQAEAAAKKHFDDKYDSESKLSVLLNAKEDVANKVASVDLEDAEGKLDLAKLSALDSQTDKYPSVSAAKAIADAVLASVDEVSAQVGDLGTTVASLKTTVGDANSGLVKAVADNTSAIQTLNGDGDGSVAKMAAAAAADAVNALGIDDYAKTSEVEATYETKENASTQYATFETKTNAATNLQTAKDYADAAVAALKVAETYETKENASAKYDTFETKANASTQYATFETKTDATSKLAEAKKYTDDEILELNLSQYAVAATVNNELANKLDSTALTANGTYMVTKTANGIEYTAVTVATAADAATE